MRTGLTIALLVAVLAMCMMRNGVSGESNAVGDGNDDWTENFQAGESARYEAEKRGTNLQDLDKWAVLHGVMEAGRRRRR